MEGLRRADNPTNVDRLVTALVEDLPVRGRLKRVLISQGISRFDQCYALLNVLSTNVPGMGPIYTAELKVGLAASLYPTFNDPGFKGAPRANLKERLTDIKRFAEMKLPSYMKLLLVRGDLDTASVSGFLDLAEEDFVRAGFRLKEIEILQKAQAVEFKKQQRRRAKRKTQG